MISGASTAPMEVPLCNSPLPIVRPLARVSDRTTRTPQGQCPASKIPSASRSQSRSPYSPATAVRAVTADHDASTNGYSQRILMTSASKPNTMDPMTKPYPKAASMSPYCSFDSSNSNLIRADALAKVWRSR